jgi:hypothetical protein
MLTRLFYQTNGLFKQVMAVHIPAPNSWWMVLVNTDSDSSNNQEDSEPEEIVLRLQGILCNKDIPPVLKSPRFWIFN